MGIFNPCTRVLSIWALLAPGVIPQYSEGFDAAELFEDDNKCKNLLAPINGEISCYVSDFDT